MQDLLITCDVTPAHRATLVDDLVGCSAVCLGAPVSVVGRVSCLEQGGGAWRRKVSEGDKRMCLWSTGGIRDEHKAVRLE